MGSGRLPRCRQCRVRDIVRFMTVGNSPLRICAEVIRSARMDHPTVVSVGSERGRDFAPEPACKLTERERHWFGLVDSMSVMTYHEEE